MSHSVKMMKDSVNNLKSASGFIPVKMCCHNSTPTRARLLSARSTATPGSPALPESPRIRSSNAAARSPARLARLKDLSAAHAAQTGYDSDDSLRLDKAGHAAVKQDIVSIKAMLLKLRRVLNETSDEDSMRSDTHNSLDNHHLTNGIFNGARADDIDVSAEDNAAQARFELAELSRQVLFLQGQLEDRDRTVRGLQNRVERDEKPRSDDRTTSCNAATQTERIRPISAGPSLLNGSTVDGSTGSLVSFRIGKVVLADFILGVIVLCAVNLLCILHLVYTCTY